MEEAAGGKHLSAALPAGGVGAVPARCGELCGGEWRALLLISADSEESCSVAVGGLLRDWPELEGLQKVNI